MRIYIDFDKLIRLRDGDPNLQSYNVEMTEVTGGTFWKAYSKEQVAGTEPFIGSKDFSSLENLMDMYPPVDLYNKKLRTLATALGPVYMRVSGSWATGTYYDFEGTTKGVPPAGYTAVLSKEQWDGVLDFAKHIGAKLVVSMANSAGAHNADGSWNPEQARLLFEYSKQQGVPIVAAEFMNEPNIMNMGGVPDGYSVEDYARDQDLFYEFLQNEFPDVLFVAPSATGDDFGAGIKVPIRVTPSEKLLSSSKHMPQVFSYHFYYGLSERGALIGGHWPADAVLSEEYLSFADIALSYYKNLRDKFAPGADLWVTETADAGLGGNTWASTFLDTFRYVDQMGRFAKQAKGVLFHNTLTASDYGLLDSKTHEPRPKYWAALLWAKLVGSVVYDTTEEIREGVHLYAHSRKDGKPGYVYILVNNSRESEVEIEIPASFESYTLTSPELRSHRTFLNGEELMLENGMDIPKIEGLKHEAEHFTAQPLSISFIII